MTLPGNEEKLRLVPVVTTLLRLSPAEVEQLQKSIQGESSQDRNSYLAESNCNSVLVFFFFFTYSS